MHSIYGQHNITCRQLSLAAAHWLYHSLSRCPFLLVCVCVIYCLPACISVNTACVWVCVCMCLHQCEHSLCVGLCVRVLASVWTQLAIVWVCACACACACISVNTACVCARGMCFASEISVRVLFHLFGGHAPNDKVCSILQLILSNNSSSLSLFKTVSKEFGECHATVSHPLIYVA